MRGRTGLVVFVAAHFLCGCGDSSEHSARAVPAPACLGGVAYKDADGDGWGTGEPILCGEGRLAPGFASVGGDCDDTDPKGHTTWPRDADGDGLGTPDDTICAGDEPPAGYVWQHAVDCDDTDPGLSRLYDVDADGDGSAPIGAAVVCGPPDGPPPGAAAAGGQDCDDNDPAISVLYHRDADGDGYAGYEGATLCGSPSVPPSGFTPYPDPFDCDDARADVNPGQMELWDATDSDCNGRMYPATCPNDQCDTAPLQVPIDQTCAGADLALIDANLGNDCRRIRWTTKVSNRGTMPVASYSLTVEHADGTATTYPISDPLGPGEQRSYVTPPFERIDSTSRLSVSAGPADCDTSNDSVSRVLEPINCLWH